MSPNTPRSADRSAILAAWRAPEPECVPPLVAAARLPASLTARARELARALSTGLREKRHRGSGVDALMREFSLSSEEGVALMCLAEALLRIPDASNVDRLIRDKLGKGDWKAHLGASPSLFVNAATWGLLITGKLVSIQSDASLSSALARLIGKGGEPLIRKGVDLAMRLLGEQFVTGQTIEEALERARSMEARGYRYSFDMLGEAAMTEADARRYLASYEHAIHAIGAAYRGCGIYAAAGISVKLSALHPRYGYAQPERMMRELLPRLRSLVLLAQRYDIGLNVDAEESDRLVPSLDVLEMILQDDVFAGWNGIGFVVQAYQKRAPFVLDYLLELARRSRHRVMVRLVKGAYWDSEVKRAQVEGLEGYPVYTRKVYTDVAYLACAKKLLARRDLLFPQFATHNAHSLSTIIELAGEPFEIGDYEFQCLHGMGETLYDQVVGKANLDRPCRIYAPVGTHETLLAYLVRRLLENGANTSFVNRVVDDSISIDELVADPVAEADRLEGEPHPRIALPRALFGAERINSQGVDLADETRREGLEHALAASRARPHRARPIVAGASQDSTRPPKRILNPADRDDEVGTVIETDEAICDASVGAAEAAAPAWAATPAERRAEILERAADLLEWHRAHLVALAVREAGKALASGVGEVREAVDFLRYYAARIRAEFDNATHVPLGPVACVSPWNFPLAIFTGQVAAALAAGNPVLAKPAEQTPLMAAAAVELLHEAGVPRDVLQLLPGQGETVGARLVADPRVRGVMFTGSTAVARVIQRTLAARGDVPLIAETGGQNCMIVDSTALTEQVVADALASAFDSAGQRCSALRVLCLQEEIADKTLDMLQGAMRELVVGDPASIATDVGPVIDGEAKQSLEAHLERMGARVRYRAVLTPACANGSFVAPALVEIDSLTVLDREVFGPVLHVLRFARDRLDALLADIDATGYGLTMGVHTRIDETVAQVTARARVGNIYVNRNIIGAVVGVQPFGGERLSGTGPKAGGPLILHRLLRKTPGPRGLRFEPSSRDAPLRAWVEWLRGEGTSVLSGPVVERLLARVPVYERESLAQLWIALPGPAGEQNTLSFARRGRVLGTGRSPAALLDQLAAAIATGNELLLVETADTRSFHDLLPLPLQQWIRLRHTLEDEEFDTALFDAETAGEAATRKLRLELADRPGPLIGLVQAAPGYDLSRLVVERTLSVNTTAAGGNTHLMTLGSEGAAQGI